MSIDKSLLASKFTAIIDQMENEIEFESVNIKGGSSVVLVGTNIVLGRKVVLKFYYWGDGVHAEPRLLSELVHDNILRVDHAAPIDDEDAYFIAPFCEGGDLDDILSSGTMGLKRAVDIMLDIASGVSFIHGAGYIHRDLKPSNVFCTANDRFVIGDFGSVVRVGKDGYAQTGSRHSLLYRTPEEVASGRAYQQGDVYQLGIVLFQLLGGRLPYDCIDWLSPKEIAEFGSLDYPDNQIYADKIIERKILKERIVSLSCLPPWCPANLISIVRKCCRLSREDRFGSVAELIAKLNNIRNSLPDWRFEPEPVLHRARAKYRIIKRPKGFAIEKMVNGAFAWRKERALSPTSLPEAVSMAEEL